MKIEFRKVPTIQKDFCIDFNSVKFSGTFCKISQKLVKIESTISGNTDVACCKCGATFNIVLDEKVDFLLSNGIYSSDDERDSDKIIIEIIGDFIDFEEILQGELESLRSDYHICEACSKESKLVELEY